MQPEKTFQITNLLEIWELAKKTELKLDFWLKSYDYICNPKYLLCSEDKFHSNHYQEVGKLFSE